MKNKKIQKISKKYGTDMMRVFHRRLIIFKQTYFTLNIFIFLAQLATSIFATLVTAYYGASLPIWYPFLTAGIGAFTTLTASLINFFLIREKIKTYQNYINSGRLEINKYNYQLVKKYQNDQRDWHLFLAFEAIIGNETAKQEVVNE